MFYLPDFGIFNLQWKWIENLVETTIQKKKSPK